ncbi:hypothetical protein ACTFIW_011188 [Dictyostelium discoideum]
MDAPSTTINEPKDINMTETTKSQQKTTTTTTTTTTNTNTDKATIELDELDEYEEEKIPPPKTKVIINGVEEEEEEEDYVIHEIPVYLSQSLSDYLYLFQYPLRQPWRPYDMSKLEELRIKPKQQKVEMDLSIDPDSDNYNPDAQTKTTKYTLSSTTVSHRTNYAIGLMKSNELHLTPLQSIIQLRPQFNYFDDKWQEEKLRKKQDTKDDDEQDEESGNGGGGGGNGQSIDPLNKIASMQFKKAGAKLSAANQQPNIIKQIENEEQWIKVNLVDDEFDGELIKQFEKLQCEDIYTDIKYDLNESQYFDMLCPRVPDEWVSKAAYIHETVSLETVHKMSLALQIKTIMTNGHVVPYTKIHQLVSQAVKRGLMDHQIIEHLETYAVLIRGRWVVKSEFVTKDSDLEIGRNYLLLQFFDSDYGIDKKEFCKDTGISYEDARELLSKISDLDNKSRRWFLKKQADDDFIDRNPYTVDKFNQQFTDENSRKELLDKVKELTNPNRHSIFGFPRIPSNYREGKTVEHQLLFLLYNFFKQQGVCSIELIKQYIASQRDLKTENNLLNQVNDKMVDEQLKKMATIVRYSYVLKTTGNQKVDKYRDIILEAFNKSGGLKKDDIINLLREKMDANYVEIPQNIFIQILTELAEAKGKVWVFKAGK